MGINEHRQPTTDAVALLLLMYFFLGETLLVGRIGRRANDGAVASALSCQPLGAGRLLVVGPHLEQG